MFEEIHGYDNNLVKTLCIQEMSKRGIHTNFSFHPTMSHTKKDIEDTVNALYETFEILKKAINSDIESYLDAPTTKEPFKRLIH